MTTNTYRAREALKRMGTKDPTFASLLKNYRQCETLTQAEMAKLLGVSVSHLSDIENERKFVGIERARIFARKLKDNEKYFVLVTLRDQLRRAKCNFEIELKSKKAS